MDQLTLIGAVHFLGFISIGALPRGTASRHSTEVLAAFYMEIGPQVTPPESPVGSGVGGGGGADASDDVEEVKIK